MKTILLAVALLAFIVAPAYAYHTQAGAKLDAPDLVKFTENLSAGLEVGKDIVQDVFYPDTLSYLEDDKGYFAYFKITYKGSLLDFTK